MASTVSCSLTPNLRTRLDLVSHPALQGAYVPQLVALALDQLQRLYPNLPVTAVSDPLDSRPAWVGPEGVVFNITSPRLKADTPLHEMGHVWLAVLKQEDPGRYNQLAGMVRDTGTHQAVAKVYPLKPGYSLDQQLDEALTWALGEAAHNRLKEQAPRTAVDRVRNWLRSFFERLASGPVGEEVDPLTLPLHEVMRRMSAEMLAAPARGDLSQSHLAFLLDTVRDQRPGVDLPSTTSELMERLTGRAAGLSDRQLESRADDIYLDTMNKAYAWVPSPSGGEQKVLFTTQDEAERKEQLKRVLAETRTSAESNLMARVLDFMKLPTKDRLARQNGTAELPDDARNADAERLFAVAVQRAFPDFRDGDTILAYGAQTTPEIYKAEYDTGNLMIRKGQRIVNGELTAIYDIVAVTAGDLTEKLGDTPLLHGLYNGGIISTVKNWGAGLAADIKLTSSNYNRQAMAATLLAMHIRSTGVGLTDSLAVAKLSLESRQADLNDVRRLYPTEFVRAWQSLARLPAVKAQMPAEMLNLLGQEKVLDASLYTRDYRRLLRDMYQTKDGKTLEAVSTALGEYEATRRASSAKALIDSAQLRLEEIKKNFGPNQEAFLKEPEVILLGEVMRSAAGGRDGLNINKEVGSIERYFQAYNSGSNPVTQWFYEQWYAARELVTDKYLTFKKQQAKLTRALMDDAHEKGGVSNNLLYHDEGKYYEPLLVFGTYDYKNPKTGVVEKVKVNEHRFKMPGTDAYNQLRPVQRAYIDHALATIKEQVTARWQSENPKLKDAEIEDKYKATWGQGYLPVVAGSVVRGMWAGDWKGQVRDRLESVLSENQYYDRNENANKDTLSDQFGMQAGTSIHGSNSRLSRLGLVAEHDYVDQATGKRETRYVIDPDGGRSRQLGNETDLMKSMDAFQLSYLKHRFMGNLNTKLWVAVSMMRNREDESGLLRGHAVNGALDGRQQSRDEADLKAMARALVLGQKSQQTGSSGTRKVGTLAAILNKGVTYGALGFSAKTAGGSLSANFFSTFAKGLASWGEKTGFRAQDMPWAFQAMMGDFGKVSALAQQLRVTKSDEFDLLHDRFITGSKMKGSDAPSESFFLDRMGDAGSRLFIMTLMMKREGTWDAYTFNKEKGVLEYDEAKDRKNRGDVVVDAVREAQILDGTLKEGEPMRSGYDNRMKRTIEAYSADVLGGYKDEVDTVLGTNLWFKILRKFRTFYVKKVERYTQEGHYNPNRGYYDKESGEWVSEYEVGIFRSVASLFGNLTQYGAMSTKAWTELRPEDRRNIKGLAWNAAMAAVLMAAGYAITGGDEEKKKKARSSRSANLGEHMLYAAVQEMWILDELLSGVAILQSPFVMIDFIARFGTASNHAMHGELDEAGRIFVKNLGVGKTWQMFAGHDDDEIKAAAPASHHKKKVSPPEALPAD